MRECNESNEWNAELTSPGWWWAHLLSNRWDSPLVDPCRCLGRKSLLLCSAASDFPHFHHRQLHREIHAWNPLLRVLVSDKELKQIVRMWCTKFWNNFETFPFKAVTRSEVSVRYRTAVFADVFRVTKFGWATRKLITHALPNMVDDKSTSIGKRSSAPLRTCAHSSWKACMVVMRRCNCCTVSWTLFWSKSSILTRTSERILANLGGRWESEIRQRCFGILAFLSMGLVKLVQRDKVWRFKDTQPTYLSRDSWRHRKTRRYS